MSEEITTSTDGSQALTSGLPQVGTPATDGQAPVSQTATTNDEHERVINELRKENAAARKRLKEFEDAEKTRADAQLTEQQKKDKQFADLQKEHADYILRSQERIITSELRVQAARLGFADPADAIAMLDRTKLVLDDDGNPTNAEDLLKSLLKAKPYLAGQTQQQRPQTGGGATQPPRSATSGAQTITKEYVAQVQSGGQQAWNALSPEEQQRISAFIRGGGLFRH